VKEFLAHYGVVNRETMVIRGGAGVIAVALESDVQDRFLEEVFATASEAGRRQLTGTRPGLLFLKFEDLTAEQMLEVGIEDGTPTVLRIRASRFLDSNSAKNVTSIGFLADGVVQRVDDDVVTRTGVNYHFLNERNAFAPLVAKGRFFE
jgi:hypothetical protein